MVKRRHDILDISADHVRVKFLAMTVWHVPAIATRTRVLNNIVVAYLLVAFDIAYLSIS